jgi:murein L,D-transpeptidase YcbB/YkuD
MKDTLSVLLTCTILLCALLTIGQPAPARAAVTQQQLTASLNRVLEDTPTTTLGYTDLQADPSTVDRVLLSMYLKNNSTPYWVTPHGPGQKAEALISVIKTADEDGLNPEHYRLKTLEKLWQSRSADDLAVLEVMLTMAMGSFVADMREGRAVSCLLDPELFAAARDHKVDLIKIIHQALTAPDLVQFLRQQAPQHQGYQSLKTALARYRTLKAQGGWQAVPEGKVLKPGMQDHRLGLLAQRLVVTGDLQQPVSAPAVYDDQLVTAVKHFQKRYNLEQDGIIGKATLAALNIPIDDHIRGLIINMERWRWLPHTLGGQRLLVNIAGFYLAGIQDEKLQITMPVIVGKLHHETPVFTHTMRYIEFNPFWNLPNSIARDEIIPKMIKDPQHLAKEHIRIFDGWGENAREVSPSSIDWKTIGKGIRRYHLRQDPAPDNALGTVKFMFPNKYNVYMHDTPAHGLFKRNKRSFSHGCIRVGDPHGLALYLLNKDTGGWTEERIKKIVASGKRTIVNLKKPFPVHILYRTVLVDPRDNTVHFYDDIYGRDTLLARALFTDKATQCRYTEN